MTSKISFFNIAREDLRRRIWMLALSCLGSFLALPVTFLLANRNYLSYVNRMTSEITPAVRLETYYSGFFQTYAMITEGIILAVGAAIVAIWGFRYLYSRKMVDLYHSIPVKRSRLFLVTYLNGLLIWLVPMITASIVTLLIMLANMASYEGAYLFGSVLLMALRQMFMAIICFLMFYHFFLVCVMLSGNVFNAIYSSAILGTAVAALYGIFYLLGDAFWNTFVSPVLSWNQILWASPLVGPIFQMSYFVNTGSLSLSANSAFSGFPVLAVGSILVMLFNFRMARKLYLNRPSELAEHGVDHRHIQTLIRLCSSIMAGLFGAIIFLMIVGDDAIGWQIFGVILCGVLIFGVSDIILHMNFKCFFAHKRQMATSILVSGLLLIIAAFDLTGFDNRLPDKDNINTANISLSGYMDNSQIYHFEGNTISGVDYNSQYLMTYTNLDLLYPLLETLTDEAHQTIEDTATTIYIDLDTDYGPFRRKYFILQSDLEALRPLVESEEYRLLAYPTASGQLPLAQSLNAKSTLDYTEYTTSDMDKMQAIMDAYTADFLDSYSIDRLNTGISVARLYLTYPDAGNDSVTLHTYNLQLRVYSHYTRTIAKLKEYYPELTLEKEDLNIASMQIAADSISHLQKLFDLGETDTGVVQNRVSETIVVTPTSTSVEYNEKAVPTMEVIDEITLTDATEIQELLPYLYIGDFHYNAFQELNRYTYLGSARLTDGSYVSCYVLSEDLPLKAPETIKQYVESIGESE